MSYKKPNRKGNRVRKKISPVMDSTLLSEFKKQHPKYNDITLVQFNSIIKQFNNNIIDEIIENRDGVRLPERLGQMIIIAFSKPKRKIIDFGTSNKTGVKTYHGNWDTDNKIGKIFYKSSISGFNIKYYKLWNFSPSRNFKKRMSSGFKKSWEKYYYMKNNDGITIRSMLNL